MAKQMITFQKTLFENAFSTMIMIQDQTEKIMSTFLDQLSWMPEEGKKAITDSVKFYKDARDNFKKSVDEGFSKMDEMLTPK